MDKKLSTIAVMTAGGDAPGMNACIRAVVRTASAYDINVIGVMNGFEGLINGEFRPLSPREVGGILGRGGTILQTHRSARFREPDAQREALRHINEEGIEAVIIIGGDGSMRGAHVLSQQGVRVVGIPASIDNDIWGTQLTIGVDTTLNTIMEAIDKLRDTASSHNRAFLVETMGRGSGYLALMAGIACGAEMVLIPEAPSSVAEVARAIEDAYKRGKNHAIVINAEGSGHRTSDLANALNQMDLGFKTRVTILGHIQRGGTPSALTRIIAMRMGYKAVTSLVEGQSAIMVALHGREVKIVSLEDVVTRERSANLDYYEMLRVLAR